MDWKGRLYFIEENPHISAPAEFIPMLCMYVYIKLFIVIIYVWPILRLCQILLFNSVHFYFNLSKVGVLISGTIIFALKSINSYRILCGSYSRLGMYMRKNIMYSLKNS